MVRVSAAPSEAQLASSAARKVSRRLLPFLFVLYIVAYLDRINVGFAQLQMKGALGFGDSVYGLGTGIFFIGYFLFEVPSNLILARTGARLWIARIMITWGLISASMAFVQTPASFYALRFLLGVAEAGFFPGIIYYLGSWFPEEQRASVVSRFMTAVPIAGVIGGPLSGALFTLDGTAGLAGWQWIFLAEGLPSVVLGIAVLFYLTDRVEDAHWLSPAERAVLGTRIRMEEQQIAARGHVGVLRALLHPTVWRLSLLLFPLVVGLYGITFWLPQIIQGFSGLGNVAVATVSAIPYLTAVVVMVVFGAHSDRTGERRLHLAVAALAGAVGMALSASARSPGAVLAALSLSAAGILSANPIVWALPTTFLTGSAAAGAIGLINSFANLGGFVGPYLIGRVHDATGSFTASLLAIAALLLCTPVLALSLRRPPPADALQASDG